VVVEGEISRLAFKPHVIDFEIGGRQVCIERSAASARLRNGDRIRVLLQTPRDEQDFHVMAFQRTTDPAMRYAGPRTGFGLAILTGLLLATGIYAGTGLVLIPVTSLLLLNLLLSADVSAARARLRRFP
jgi:hypothetical protein